MLIAGRPGHGRAAGITDVAGTGVVLIEVEIVNCQTGSWLDQWKNAVLVCAVLAPFCNSEFCISVFQLWWLLYNLLSSL